MHLNDFGPSPLAPVSVRRALGRVLVSAALCFVMIAPVAAQRGDDEQDTPYGSPFGSGRQQRGGRAGQQSTVNPSVDPIGGSSGDRFEPVVISGSDRRLFTSGSLDQPLLKPAPKPNEFETYVERAIGRRLPRFGADLVLPSNRDFAVPATATVPPDYVLNVGDVVSISLTGSAEGSVDKEIDTDGKIFLPRIGSIKLAGVRYADLKSRVSAAVGTQYRGYDVTVGIRQLRGIRVYVTGFANNPGAFTVNSLSTMANAVFASGGPASGGSFRTIQLYRRGRLVSNFDLYDLILRGDHSHDTVLQNEDTLVIQPVGEQVAVVGSVNQEAIFEVKRGETVGSVLGFAGGSNDLADKSRLILYRLSDLETTGSQEISTSQAGTLPAEAGSLVQVLSSGTLQRSVSRQAALVRVEGEVNRPGNYYVPADATVEQVMALAGGPTQRAFVFGTRLERSSVRRQQAAALAEVVQQLEVTLATAPLTSDSALDAGARAAQLSGARAFLDRIRETQPDGRIVLDLPPMATALPGYLPVENNDRIVIPAKASTVSVFGAVFRPASFLFDDGHPLRVKEYLDRAGGPIRAADRGRLFLLRANGSVVTRSKGAMSARVLPGDVIFMPVKTQSTSVWARIAQVTSIISQLGFSAAALAVLNNQ